MIKTFKRTRDGNTVEEMDENIIKAWNDQVGINDIVFHLGDVSFHRDKERTREILYSLKGKIHLIMGNHDLEKKLPLERFESVQDMLLVKVKNYKMAHLCHYPMLEPYRHAYHLHGHSHGSFKWTKNRADVGIDARKDKNMRLWQLEELYSILQRIQ